jgi:hypothetical protein
MATMAASNVTNTASLRVTKTASCAIDGVIADNRPVALGSSGGQAEVHQHHEHFGSFDSSAKIARSMTVTGAW